MLVVRFYNLNTDKCVGEGYYIPSKDFLKTHIFQSINPMQKELEMESIR